MTAVTPLLVSRRSQRRFSMARMRAMFRCCQGALVSPYQPSSLMFTSTSAPLRAKLPHLVGKDRFVADEDAIAMRAVAATEDLALGAAGERRDAAGELVRKEEQVLERNVFAERHEVNLVVAADAPAVRRQTTIAEL